MSTYFLPTGSTPVGFYDNEAVGTPDGWRFSMVQLTAVDQENAHFLAPATF